jgi:glutamate-1-semialdehyde 2,1-aminomutase
MLGEVMEVWWRWVPFVADGAGGHPGIMLAALVLAGVALAIALRRVVRSVSTWRAVSLTPRVARVLSRLVGPLDYSMEGFLRADGAPDTLAGRRAEAIERLSDELRRRSSRSSLWSDELRGSFSDLRFTDTNRVPFPFARLVREYLAVCSVVVGSRGPQLVDLDGNWTLDVSGAYGVNVAGFDRYKQWMQRGLERVADVGPVLGPLHPVVAENVALLKEISGQDEVSFHMSGTEAVMAAVRLVRHNTRRRLIVCFAGAYHGWWDGVQPGLGSERDIGDCLTLKDMSPASLDVIRRRASEIAAVLVNPVQCFHPNSPPPSDTVLLTSDVRRASDGQGENAYREWLHRLRDACAASDVPLVFDEVYSGFRLAPGGAQEHFGVRADMVVYGKTVAGGMPIGLVCGRHDLMRRFDDGRPMRVAYVVGTFSAHPVVMGAMREFLGWVTSRETSRIYREANERCARWVRETNDLLATQSLPLRIGHLGTIWTVLFEEPGRYNWLLQYYLRAGGLGLSWVGTGRCLSSFDFEEHHYVQLREAIVNAARRMKDDGWWPSEEDLPGRERKMKLKIAAEIASSIVRIPHSLRAFVAEVVQRKHDDHEASHHDRVNQVLHIVSSSVFIYCYAVVFTDVTRAMWLGLPALFVRQIGHAIFEPPCHDREAKLLGFDTRSKTAIVAIYLLIPLLQLGLAIGHGTVAPGYLAGDVAWQWLLFTLMVVVGRVLYLASRLGVRSSLIWFVKLLTDPFSDLLAYVPLHLRRA